MGETLTIDQIEQRLIDDESLIGRLRARQMANLEVLDRAQVATGDGSRSLSEWVGTRLDMSRDSARGPVRTMRRTTDRSDLREALASGDVSFDRVEALSKISEDVGLLPHLDVAGVYREAARRTRLTPEDEVRTASDSYLFFQPNLDESWAQVRGGMDGYSYHLVDKALTEKADAQPDLPDGTRGDRSWRKATALVELCTGGESPPAQVTVFVDAKEAAASNGEAGVMLEAGPKVGPQALQAILCDAVTELTVNGDDAPLARTPFGRWRAVPPLRRGRRLSPLFKRGPSSHSEDEGGFPLVRGWCY